MPDTSNPSDGLSLGGLIRAERERQGLSLRQLGRLVGVDASAVLLWERDETVPRGKHIAALSRALELPAHDLMSRTGAEFPSDLSLLPAMLRAEYDLPPEAISDIERYIARTAKKYHATKPTKPTERRTP